MTPNARARLRRLVTGWVVPVLLLLTWEYLARQGGRFSFAFVPLAEAWTELLGMLRDGSLLHHVAATLRRMLTGWLLGCTAGVLFGTILGISRLADGLLAPLFHAFRQVPLLGWIPLFALWFGAGDLSEVLVIFLASFYPVVIHAHEGVRSVDVAYHEAGAVLGFTPLQRFRLVLLPAAMPSVITGVTQALGFAWLSAIGSELLFGEGTGIGSLMILAETSGRMEILIVCILVVGAIGMLMSHLIREGARHALRWKEEFPR